MQMRILRIAVFSLFCLSTIWGQSVSTSQITGAVRDATGLPVPGAEVKVTQTSTGAVRSVMSGPDGAYVIPNLPVGPYQLEVSKEGFSKYVQTGILLQVDSNPTIDTILQLGSVAEQVVVQADAAMVETQKTGVGQVVDSTRVVDLPLNGRQETQLIFLAGAASLGAAGDLNSNKNYPNIVISVAGGQGNGLTYLLDGGTHNDPYNNLSIPLPFPDALQEFKVETSALPAQYGHHSAAAVNAVTKSGTNDYHGDLFEFVRNGDLNARDFFASTRDTLKRNQFGGVLGGPIHRNRLFFFLGYQGTIQRSDPTQSTGFVPTEAMLNGNFTQFASAACNAKGQINLPASLGFTNDMISPTLLNASALEIASHLPVTQNPCGRVLYGTLQNYVEHLGIGRVDYQLSSRHSVFGRFEAAHLDQPSSYTGTNLLAATTGNLAYRDYSAVLGDTYLIGSGTISSFHFTVNRITSVKTPKPFFSAEDLGINMYVPYPTYITLSVTSAFSLGGASDTPGHFNSTNFQTAEDITLVRGSHQIAFGVNYMHPELNVLSTLNANGSFTFSGQISGLALVDFLLGKPSAFSQGTSTLIYDRQQYVGLYAQDSWRLSSRLTVNAGLRWEPFLPTYSKYGHFDHFSPAWFASGERSSVYVNAPAGEMFPGDPGFPGNAFSFSKLSDVAPRFGIVLDPKGDGRMTIRAAYGVFYDLPHLFFTSGWGQDPPYGSLVSLTSPAGGFSNPWQGYAGGNPFPIVLSDKITFPTAGTYVSAPLHVNPTYLNQWNLSIQKQVGRDWLVTGNYLGDSTIHLWTGNQENPAVFMGLGPCVINNVSYSTCSTLANVNQRRLLYLQNPAQGQYYAGINQLDDGGTANYNALLVSLQRRLEHGVTILANYTLSHCIGDLANSELGVTGPLYTVPFDRRSDRGNCATSDRRQIFNLSAVGQSPKFSSRLAQTIAGDWQLSAIMSAQSAQHFSVTTGVDNALTGQSAERPNLVLTNTYPASQTVNTWISSAAFASPDSGTYGNLGINNLLGPGSLQLDMSLSRVFRVREGQSLHFRAEAFNILNRLNASTPVSSLSAANFGQITSDINGSITTTGDPRILQLALKYLF
jgi:Carboxypeptidase regulatory-like domain